MKRYDISWDRLEFDKAERLVRAVLLQSGRAQQRSLRLVTSDPALLQSENRDYVEASSDALGVCFGHEEDQVFDIWLSPAYTDYSNDLFHDTILHELCHGHLGLYKHNQRFRRFFSRVLFHYNDLVSPIDYSKQISDTVRRYTDQRADESLSKYVDRMYAEQTSAEKVAITEAPVVAQTYKRLTLKESRG